jgi:DHA1 family bicyclomycin/chloramphenicol resistance-like MFS transporter|tara:strand:- start:10148 stop:11383 length:1236 start_codon:yes stop_codon:yes gene_type:complete
VPLFKVTQQPKFFEFVVLMAMIISMVALSIDAMLPALPNIAADLGVTRINDSQYVISILFAGMAIGQMIFGPMSDSVGRKYAINVGFAVFIVGCLVSLLAETFTMMLIGRFLQGFGAAGPRVVSIALVRDRYEGREMARVMSFVMTIFILVPIVAPALGQAILMFSDWRGIFWMFLVLSFIALSWFNLRQPETLLVENRIRFSIKQVLSDIKYICVIPAAMGYTIATGIIFGAFLGYLSSSQQIFQQQYHLGNQFVIYFGILAASLGLASLLNAQLVMRFGMRRLSHGATFFIVVLSVPFYFLAQHYSGSPPLWQVMAYLLAVFFFVGILFGNLNALAMEPLGSVAGLGAAVVGSLSTLISVALGVIIANAYNGTILPLVSGFALLSIGCLMVMGWTEIMSAKALKAPVKI